MNSIYRDIFKAIHEGKWLKIEYRNKDDQITKYWIGIRDLDVRHRTLKVDGLHLTQYTIGTFDRIFIDSILSAQIVEGSYCEINQELVNDIDIHPEKYKKMFDHAANLKILTYLEMCNRMDTTPYISDFEMIHFLDADIIRGTEYALTDQQFRDIVQNFQIQMEKKKIQTNGILKIRQLAMNVLSIHTHASNQLYVLAYRKLNLDVKARVLRPDEGITICTQFSLNGTQQSIRKFLDADDYELLENFEQNHEKIKDCITKRNARFQVDDMPYVIGLGYDVVLDLHSEYNAIIDMYQKDEITFPIRAFFGDMLSRPRSSATNPIALINRNVNVDQLLAINNAMKYPVAYIQGPPGTGKTNTIMNTLITAFFNNKTVLFCSYNNTPIDSVFERLSHMTYYNNTIPFPVLRLGNHDKVKAAIGYINQLRKQVAALKVFESTLDKRKDERIARAKQLTQRLREYEELLDLKERRETLLRVMEYQEGVQNAMNLLPFQVDLQGHQLQTIEKKIEVLGEFSDEDALQLLDQKEEEFSQYLYYTSVKYIQKLEGKSYEDLRKILDSDEDIEKQASAFSEYLTNNAHVEKLQKIFPIIITTCISAHKLGKPAVLFDMTVMDEASQCNVAISLVPIIRGKKLMLVGDPQQLNPVVLLDELTNQKLRKRYHVSEEYDYCKNSIYKTYLACDAISDEVLLHNHYRCNKSIIEFNNRKYYNSKLNICSKSRENHPLVYVDIPQSTSDIKNAAPGEVAQMIAFAKMNQEKRIGVITPFVNQRQLMEQAIREEKLTNVDCGTVHAFQGDEKDIILFSTAITDRTSQGTYDWLKNNKELLNVATSRAKDKLIVLSNTEALNRLHGDSKDDDLYELVQYIRTNGESQVTSKQAHSRALGIKPFSTATENAFLENLTYALENIWLSEYKYAVHKEVAISQVFENNTTYNDLFYMGRFDFVVYEKQGRTEIPILAIELDGKEHFEDEVVKERDRRKNQICQEHHLQLIRVENSYARRYHYIKQILMDYFRLS